MSKVFTFLTFKKDGLKAIEMYTSLIKNSEISHSMMMPGTEQLLHASFTLDGQSFMAMDGGDYFNFSEGVSIFINCDNQEEVDSYWEKLTADGGEPSQCGWLKDKYGVSWQIIPSRLGELMGDPDPVKSQKVMQCMLKMNKIIIKDLEDAYKS
jgi:predicted 3-demethylubiquinone-9 3-methyltransferase (glyoxalase superfamily)